MSLALLSVPSGLLMKSAILLNCILVTFADATPAISAARICSAVRPLFADSMALARNAAATASLFANATAAWPVAKNCLLVIPASFGDVVFVFMSIDASTDG